MYDYMVWGFFEFLVGLAGGHVIVPGTPELVPLGNAWLTKAQTAQGRAAKAFGYEVDENPLLAIEEWQKIFGTDIS